MQDANVQHIIADLRSADLLDSAGLAAPGGPPQPATYPRRLGDHYAHVACDELRAARGSAPIGSVEDERYRSAARSKTADPELLGQLLPSSCPPDSHIRTCRDHKACTSEDDARLLRR